MLEDLWLQRLNTAKLRLDFARNYVKEVQRDYPAGDAVPSSDHHCAHQTAPRAENMALSKYNQLLGIVGNLMLRGILPDEAAWLKATNGSGEPE